MALPGVLELIKNKGAFRGGTSEMADAFTRCSAEEQQSIVDVLRPLAPFSTVLSKVRLDVVGDYCSDLRRTFVVAWALGTLGRQ